MEQVYDTGVFHDFIKIGGWDKRVHDSLCNTEIEFGLKRNNSATQTCSLELLPYDAKETSTNRFGHLGESYLKFLTLNIFIKKLGLPPQFLDSKKHIKTRKTN